MLRQSAPSEKTHHVNKRSSTATILSNVQAVKTHKKDDPKSQHKPSELIPFSELTISSVEIGFGAYSCVYHGRWGENIVAIKRMHYSEESETPSTSDSGEVHTITLDQCENEAKILCMIAEYNIHSVVAYHGRAIQKPFYYIITEFIPSSLTDFLKTPNIPWNIRYEIIKGMTQCVVHLHDHGIVHRDIKSDNFLVSVQEKKESDKNNTQVQVKICDFGVATSKALPRLLEGFQGSRMWQAPEVLSEVAQTEASDVYSLAISIWEVATQEELYKGLNLPQITAQVIKGERPTIPETCPTIMDKFLRWGWQQQPDKRPTAAQMLNELGTDIDHLSANLMEMKF